MKKNLIIGLALSLVVSLMAATPKEDLKAAVKKLADKPNYSWTTTTEMEGAQFTPGVIKGKTEKDGFALVTQERNDRTTEAVVKGDKGAVRTQDGWRTVEELRQAAQGGGGGRGMMAGRLAMTRVPAKEAENILEKVKDVKAADGGVFTADLTEEGAKELISFRRPSGSGQQQGPGAKNAQGSVKFWVKDGMLVKYELSLKGTVIFGQDQQERDMARKTTVEIKDVGATKVEVPEEAKKKLAGGA
jgi:hypothetical protein